MTLEEYKERIAGSLLARASNLDQFRELWITPPDRRELIAGLPDAGRSAPLVRAVEEMADFDLYDVLAELGYGLDPRPASPGPTPSATSTRPGSPACRRRPRPPSQALTRQFARAGTEELENPGVLSTPDVLAAGGLAALKLLGSPAEILRATKERLFAA